MRQPIHTTLAAAALFALAGLTHAADRHAPQPGSAPANAAVGSGSGGTVEGRKAGTTNANSMGEPVQGQKSMKKGHKTDKRAHGARSDRQDAQANASVGSGSGGTVEGRAEATTNSNSKGDPVKTK